MLKIQNEMLDYSLGLDCRGGRREVCGTATLGSGYTDAEAVLGSSPQQSGKRQEGSKEGKAR